MKKFYLLLFICSVLIFSCKTETKITTTILKGKVIDRDYSKSLHLIKKNGDYRIDYIEIPIINGEFNYTLKSNIIEQYQMSFKDELDKGAWMRVDFFNDADTVKFTLNPKKNYKLNKIVGGKLNQKNTGFRNNSMLLFFDRAESYNSIIDSLYKIKQWDSEEVTEIYSKISKEKDRIKQRKLYETIEKIRKDKKDLTPVARSIKNKIDAIIVDYRDWEANLIMTDKTLFGYSLLMDELYSNTYEPNFDITVIEKQLKIYQSKFKNHPYTATSTNIINGIKNAKVGGFYKEISALSDDEKLVSLSKTISNNKLTLIDLWAPWCGPCIAKDKLLKPEYSKLKAKGFEVFAVVGGIKEKEQYEKTKKKYNYPWKLNYELNQEFKIWEKYNIGRSGGSQFLVNSKGKILAVNPYPKEIDSLLNILP